MPAPIIWQDQSGLGQGISQAGGALGQALQFRAQEAQMQRQTQKQQVQQQQYNTILQNTLAQLPESPTPGQIQSTFNSLLSQGVPKEYVQTAFSLYQPQLKAGIKEESDVAMLRQLGLIPGEKVVEESTQTPQFLGKTPESTETVKPPSQNPIQKWSEDQLVAAAATNIPAVQKAAELEQKRRDIEHRRFVEDRKYHSEKIKESEKKVSGLREALPRKKVANTMAMNAVQSGEVGAFSLANLAERTGFKELATAKGAQLATASKENLLSNMARVSAKAQNQWFEQRLASMFPQVGQSIEANETIMEMLSAENATDEAYLNNYDKISDEDREKYGYVRENIEKRARKETEKEETEIFDRMLYRTRQIWEREKGTSWLKDQVNKKAPIGTIATENMIGIFIDQYDGDVKKAIQNMKKLGYNIPTMGEIQIWQ